MCTDERMIRTDSKKYDGNINMFISFYCQNNVFIKMFKYNPHIIYQKSQQVMAGISFYLFSVAFYMISLMCWKKLFLPCVTP